MFSRKRNLAIKRSETTEYEMKCLQYSFLAQRLLFIMIRFFKKNSHNRYLQITKKNNRHTSVCVWYDKKSKNFWDVASNFCRNFFVCVQFRSIQTSIRNLNTFGFRSRNNFNSVNIDRKPAIHFMDQNEYASSCVSPKSYGIYKHAMKQIINCFSMEIGPAKLLRKDGNRKCWKPKDMRVMMKH